MAILQTEAFLSDALNMPFWSYHTQGHGSYVFKLRRETQRRSAMEEETQQCVPQNLLAGLRGEGSAL